MLYPKMTSQRSVLSLDGFWHFCKDEEQQGRKKNWQETILKGREVAVPASINEQCSDLMDYFGWCWFEKDFALPASVREGKVYLRFGSVTGKCTVWLNGRQVAYHEGSCLPFTCEIGKDLVEGENHLVVLSDNTLDPWAIPPAAMVSKEGREGFFVSHPAVTYDFFPYSGIHRSVCLYTTGQDYIDDITIRTDLEGEAAKISFAIELQTESEGTVQVQVEDETVTLPFTAKQKQVEGSLRLANPRLWDVGEPNLYEMQVKMQTKRGEKDSYVETFGIRTVEVQGNALLLNGKPIYLRGFGKHEDFQVLGKGFHPAMVVKDFDLMNWVGANSFRTCHYPYEEQILDYADRHGILVIDETPMVGLNQRMYTEEVLGRAKGLIRDLIKRDKNHPSVIMWSMANEPDARGEQADAFFCQLQQEVKRLDLTRPLTYVAFNEPNDNGPLQYCDVVCINKYFGWYVTPGELQVATEQFSECLDAYYEAFHKPILVAEFGADAVAGMHFEPARMFSEEYQSEILEKQCRLIESKPYTIGTHVWTFADFMVGQSYTRVLLNRKGVFTRDRQPKLSAHTLRRIWKENQ